MRRASFFRFLLAGALLLPASAGTPSTAEFDLAGRQQWLDTGLDVHAGDQLAFSATGALQYPKTTEDATPDGMHRGWKDLVRILPLNEVGRGALIGRIGDSDAAQPFLIGSKASVTAPVDGRLFLGINQTGGDEPPGSYHITLALSKAEALAPVDDSRLPQFTEEMLNRVPVRVSGTDGTPGDRVNFVILGAEEQVTGALSAAGWVHVDKDVNNAIVSVAMATLSRQSYVRMPMSPLMLFDRTQDYGFAHAEPLVVVASRHHFRLWKAPFDAGGTSVWIGAGTHDIGFDRDQRNGALTHKIDPDTDKEREFIADTLKQTGQVARTNYLTPANPLTAARTAHGEEFHSDGRTLVIVLRPTAR